MSIEGEVFIGSLTNLSRGEKKEILEKEAREIKNKRFNKIKISISPKQVDKELLKMLKKYNVSTIELEAQSTNDYILKRCGYIYNYEDIKKATRMIKWRRYNVSFQVGIGLPDSTKIDELNTAKELATELETDFNNGKYEPLNLNQAIERCKDVVYEFNRKHIKQISIVKQNELEKSKETKIVSGPYHEEFGQLVTDSIWYDSIVERIKKFNVKVKTVKIEVNPKELPNIVGYKWENAKRLKEFYEVDIKAEGNPEIKFGKSRITVLEVYSN